MTFNQDEITLLKHTCAMLKPVANILTHLFYNRLFEQAPSVRGMFKGDLYIQHAKLMATLDYIVDVLDRPETLQATAMRLGREHRDYGVQSKDYDTMGQALLWALAETLGPGYTPDVEQAWKKLYGLLVETMKAAAKTD